MCFTLSPRLVINLAFPLRTPQKDSSSVCVRHAATRPLHLIMGDCNTATHERTPSVRDITVVFHKVDCHEQNQNSDHEYDECNDAAEHLPLRGDCRVSHGYGFGEDDDAACDDAPRKEEVTGRHNSLEGGKKQTPLCPLAFCVRSEPACEEGTGEQQGRKF